MRGLDADEMRLARSLVGSTVPLYHQPALVYPPEDQERIQGMIARGLVVALTCLCGYKHPQLTALGLEAMSLQRATEES